LCVLGFLAKSAIETLHAGVGGRLAWVAEVALDMESESLIEQAQSSSEQLDEQTGA
jgi:hypothetical protein